MAWNEPGGNGKDPWGHRKNEPGPPDLDEVVKKVQDKLGGLFGRKPPKPGNGGSDKFNWSGMGFIVLLLFLIWAAFGFYIIQPAQQGVVTRFGEYNRTTDQGLNWHIPYPIEHVKKVNVQQVNAITHKALMLTQDENLIEIELVVQYRVKNPKNYLFEVLKPDDTLYQATESALREIVGTSKMDQVLTSERSRVAIETKELIQQIINQYQTGLLVISVNMQDAQPPAQVQDAFADVIKAREDEERHKNKAQAYANEVVQRAGGRADQLRQEAQAYKAQVTARADGETQRFLSILKEYEQAPAVTRKRLYLETMETVLTNTRKVLVDIEGNNNIMLLELGELLKQTPDEQRNNQTAPNTLSNDSQNASSPITQSDSHRRPDDARSRGNRQ